MCLAFSCGVLVGETGGDSMNIAIPFLFLLDIFMRGSEAWIHSIVSERIAIPFNVITVFNNINGHLKRGVDECSSEFIDKENFRDS